MLEFKLASLLLAASWLAVASSAPQLSSGQQNPVGETQNQNVNINLNLTDGKQADRRQQGGRPAAPAPSDDEYLVGVGITDITGPSADINLMGYAKPNQDAGGIHLRQFSRTIIVEDSSRNRIVYNAIDNGMVSQLLRAEVLKRLSSRFGANLYNESNVMMSASHSHSCPGGFFQYLLYNIPSAGFISQTLNSLADGIVQSVESAHEQMRSARIYYHEGELLDASVNRSPLSYANNPQKERARFQHDTDKTMQLLKVVDSQTGEPMAMVNWFAVHGTSMNNSNHLISSDNKGYASLLFEQDFSPAGSLPGAGKFVAIFAQANEGDVSPNTRGPRCIDTGLPCDALTSTCGNPPRGAGERRRTGSAAGKPNEPPARQVRWQESVWSPRRLVGSLMRAERKEQQPERPAGSRVNERCIASGPGRDMFESTKIIAHKQYQKARQLFADQSGLMQLKGPVRFVHEYIDMTKQQVPLYKSVVDLARSRRARKLEPSIAVNETYHTCQAGLGYSFAAGTTDGPGAFDFQQAATASSRYWNMVRDFLKNPSPQQVQCHHPKPILLSTGEMDFPYMWHPRVVPTQIFMLGQVAIVGLPGEFTTMAGRRVRQAVLDRLQNGISFDLSPEPEEDLDDSELDDDYEGGNANAKRLRRTKRAYSTTNDAKVILSGLSNIYSSYVTTVEEYELQRYEGASTLYGPHTLQAYVNQFRKLADHLISEEPLEPNGLQPPDLTKSLFSLKTGVIFDGTQAGRKFGDVLNDVNDTNIYKCQEVVEVDFVAGNPRNDLRHGDSFLYVDKFVGNGTWLPVASDASWETKFIWERTNTLLGESLAKIVWEIPHNCQTGVYRIRHYGASKNLLQTIHQYSGQSSPFRVVAGATSALMAANEAKHLDGLLESAKEAQAAEISLAEANSDQQKRLGHESEPNKPRGASFYSAVGNLFSWLRN